MQVTLDVPEDISRLLADSAVALTRVALEALALDALRTGKLSPAQARRLLGFTSRYQMDGFLKEHEVFLPLTLEDIRRDAETALAFSDR
ncbi:MAG: hypothetical protein JWN34_642 [Bryobacterales bacterium]|jgi:hypothetical protein|nr:hypothetical protein [Bryobacterales bacterium]